MIRRLVVVATLVSSVALAEAPAATPSLPDRPVRTHLDVLAFSTDGGTILARARVEGGLVPDTYEVWSSIAPNRERFDIPAPTSTQKASDPTSCESRLAALSASLKKHGLTGVTVLPSACHKRAAVVVVDKKRKPDLKAALFNARGTELVRDGYQIRFRSTTISVTKDEATLCTLVRAKHEAPVELRISATPGTKLLYATEESSIGDQTLVGLCGGTPLVALPIQ